MGLIPLRRRDGTIVAYAIVDDADLKWIGQWRWSLNPHGYARRTDRSDGRERSVRMHRQILGLTYGDGREVDHVNRVKLDNRRSNLRVVSHAENHQNVGAHPRSTSRFRGVCYIAEKRLWYAQVGLDGRRHKLDYFRSEEEAAAAAAAFRAEHMPYSIEAVIA